MKNVLIIGATGNIGSRVVEFLKDEKDRDITQFTRNKKRIKNSLKVFEGDIYNENDLNNAMKGKDIVFAGVSGDMGTLAKRIVDAMKNNHVSKIIFICSIDIYKEPVKSILKPYREAADIIVDSGLDYTILRPSWYTSGSEIEYEITENPKDEKTGTVSMNSLAYFISEVIKNPEKYSHKNLGISKD